MGKVQGDCSVIGIADLLQFLAQGNKEGVLTIRMADQRKSIYLSPTGMRLISTTTRRTSSLGEILIRTKRITRPQLDQLLEEQKRTGKKLGEIVGKMAIVSKKDIDKALREQVEEEIYDLFTWSDSQFEFVEGPPSIKADSPMTDTVIASNPTSVMLEAARRADEVREIMKVVQSEKMIPMKTTRTFDAASLGEDQDVVQAVYAQVTGRYAVEEVIRRSLFPKFDALRALYLLASKGFVRIFEREGAVAGPGKIDAKPAKIPGTHRPDESHAAPGGVRSSHPPAPDSGKPTILLLGEMLKYRSILAAILRDGGYDVIEEVASQALNLINEGRRLDCVILDIGISAADGFQFCAWLADNSKAPIIVLSTDASREAAQLAMSSGARAYIVKPFTREVILERLVELLRASPVPRGA